jgi:hypothetical protein
MDDGQRYPEEQGRSSFDIGHGPRPVQDQLHCIVKDDCSKDASILDRS